MNTTALAAGPKPVASRWIGATFAGWCAGFVLSILFLVAIESVGIPNTQFPLALGMGLAVGFTQGRVLAPRLGGRWRWILTSSIGLAAPFIVMDLFQAFGVDVPYALAAYIGIGGLAVGVLQAGVLSAIAQRAVWWVPSAAAGWVLAGSSVFVAERFIPPGIVGIAGLLLYVGIILLGGIALGAVEAMALHRIVDAPQRDDDDYESVR